MAWGEIARGLFWATGIVYAVSSTLYVGFLTGLSDWAAKAARRLLWLGFVLHTLEVSARGFAGHHPAASVTETLGFLAWLIVLVFIVTQARRPLDAVGAFVAPGALMVLVLARLAPDDGRPDGLGSLGRIHISLAALGIAIFALATVFAALYLVQERQLKQKRLGALVKRGAALDRLDHLMHRAVQFGFPIFTVAMVTGAVWGARSPGALRPEYLAAVVAWLAFAAALVSRRAAGWRGRRVALLTVVGFLSAAAVLAVYLVRAVIGA
jgi:ABC-type uncharacterized transport system permease subunit